MKKNDNFFRIISPITVSVVGILDVAILCFAVFSVKKLISLANAYAIIFSLFELVAIVLAVLVTKDVLSQGIKFGEDELEFTHIDADNIFKYDEIISVETEKDKKASLIKNFRDRQSKLILNLTGDRVATIEIGLTTDKTLADAADLIKSKLPNKEQNEK